MQNYDPFDFEDEEYKVVRSHFQPNVKAMLRPRYVESVNNLRQAVGTNPCSDDQLDAFL
jgi:hypothetical protein